MRKGSYERYRPVRENLDEYRWPVSAYIVSFRVEGMKKIMDNFNNYTLKAVCAYFFPLKLILSVIATPVHGYSNAKLRNNFHAVRKTT
jgi:hypothetical protein